MKNSIKKSLKSMAAGLMCAALMAASLSCLNASGATISENNQIAAVSATPNDMAIAINNYADVVDKLALLISNQASTNQQIKDAITALQTPMNALQSAYATLSVSEQANYTDVKRALDNAGFLLPNSNVLVDNVVSFTSLEYNISLLPDISVAVSSDIPNMEGCVTQYDALTADKKLVFNKFYSGNKMEGYRNYVTNNRGDYTIPYSITAGYMAGFDLTKTDIVTFARTFSCNANASVKVYTTAGTELTDGIIGTGMIVKLYKNDIIAEEYAVVIFGDIDGNGLINAIDLLTLKRHILSLKTITGIALDAANTNRDTSQTVNAIDLLQLKKHILNSLTITQN